MKYEPTSLNQARAAFKQIWGYDDFRPPQGEIVSSLLAGKDTMIIMPTGGGKSICFQLPALLQTGLTLVISPLVALMENQVQELRDRNLPAALLHSQLPTQQRQQTMQSLQQNKLRLLYLSPETLLSKPVWAIISQPHIPINGLILDEAHCLVQWGDTFRPAYRRLGTVRSALLKSKPEGTKIAIAAFTATANPQAQQTINKVLQLHKPEAFLLSPYRSNLHLQVQTVWTPRGRRQQLLNFIKARPKEAGLVYVRTRKDSENLADLLEDAGYKTAAYHAGLSPESRRKIETAWLNNDLKFVVCSCAFGMGINKPDVRWVVHFQAPLLLSEYIQEIGRGGRDGKSAIALTLISEPTGLLYPDDKQRAQFFQDKLRSQFREAQQLAKQLPAKGDADAVGREFPESAIALSILHSSGQLRWEDPFNYAIDKSAQQKGGKQNFTAPEEMAKYLKHRECRWQFLLQAFGFTKEATSMRCGHCDNCR
ncbi:MAG: ATP-dependent DNA helicase RecQ [Microcoleus sp. PH2017_40_RAT_O_B]|uniref:RecQ family ATP-dependent DNA helicase n=1 Tax=unclassified Microcoleus TaxID=2642155 RepID=UPI001E0BBC1F|nr:MULTISPECIES: RecQ family ATP-dependent DNA helicase [unclassified Microcoleus]TAF84845.1 MAG: ATP-dependent DNA helicase RecQ [Oscillatoriales cyanobacterium]MCC3446795.1 ATP-dependent DNA helicase RecQ [Microcoleus sp. PH2017_09_SFU_O_A]MCC3571621.1 ATP-dependent DNA helicase RecQ [Microcoleus sp. PH2017_34_RAT_O_A]MCC3609818.1 ATP-dependent DNA helicase RecQ [Microcoleus sp. PH2017_40_RAT_O_B]MCC3627742.1 ATP-dependent DNA helicase RecQ [Microcoleus sp. PH2017_39_LGB_O_B]